MADRTVLVAPERMDGWVERFGRRHGEPVVRRTDTTVLLTAPDGATAAYDDAPVPATFGLVLVRRGGYAVGLVQRTELVGSKCGTRYVQGKTKAGGWSQKRYARRRANQASDLAKACAAAISTVLRGTGVADLYCGGDRGLVREALGVSGLALEPHERWLDVPEPRHAVLADALAQARAVRVQLNSLA